MEKGGASRDLSCDLADRLGHRFRRPDLLEQALTHASIASGVGANFERLEFLGDRVLGLAIAHVLYERFPDESEADMARRHGALVRRDALADVARGLGLGRFLRMARGEDDSGGRDNPTILADACEALLGALYLDGGFAPAERLVRAHWLPLIERSPLPPRDAKTMLQEWAQARGLPLPDYILVASAGPPHEPIFDIEARLAGHEPATGRGRSRRAAEQEAAAMHHRIGRAVPADVACAGAAATGGQRVVGPLGPGQVQELAHVLTQGRILAVFVDVRQVREGEPHVPRRHRVRGRNPSSPDR